MRLEVRRAGRAGSSQSPRWSEPSSAGATARTEVRTEPKAGQLLSVRSPTSTGTESSRGGRTSLRQPPCDSDRARLHLRRQTLAELVCCWFNRCWLDPSDLTQRQLANLCWTLAEPWIFLGRGVCSTVACSKLLGRRSICDNVLLRRSSPKLFFFSLIWRTDKLLSNCTYCIEKYYCACTYWMLLNFTLNKILSSILKT